MDSILKLKSEFDSLVAKIKIPGAEVSETYENIAKTWRREVG
jgi:hypothetical protein